MRAAGRQLGSAKRLLALVFSEERRRRIWARPAQRLAHVTFLFTSLCSRSQPLAAEQMFPGLLCPTGTAPWERSAAGCRLAARGRFLLLVPFPEAWSRSQVDILFPGLMEHLPPGFTPVDGHPADLPWPPLPGCPPCRVWAVSQLCSARCPSPECAFSVPSVSGAAGRPPRPREGGALPPGGCRWRRCPCHCVCWAPGGPRPGRRGSCAGDT